MSINTINNNQAARFDGDPPVDFQGGLFFGAGKEGGMALSGARVYAGRRLYKYDSYAGAHSSFFVGGGVDIGLGGKYPFVGPSAILEYKMSSGITAAATAAVGKRLNDGGKNLTSSLFGIEAGYKFLEDRAAFTMRYQFFKVHNSNFEIERPSSTLIQTAGFQLGLTLSF